MVRLTLIRDIRKALDEHSKFNQVDFFINEFENELTIGYHYDDRFWLKVEIPSIGITFDGLVSPGRYTSEEKFSAIGESRLYAVIKDWLNSVWSEISAAPVIRSILDQEATINEIKEKLKHVPDGLFDNSEIENLKLTISKTESELGNRINDLNHDQEDIKKNLEELRKEIEILTATLHTSTKRNWYLAFAVKILNWLSKAENRKFLSDSKDYMENTVLPMITHAVKT